MYIISFAGPPLLKYVIFVSFWSPNFSLEQLYFDFWSILAEAYLVRHIGMAWFYA